MREGMEDKKSALAKNGAEAVFAGRAISRGFTRKTTEDTLTDKKIEAPPRLFTLA